MYMVTSIIEVYLKSQTLQIIKLHGVQSSVLKLCLKPYSVYESFTWIEAMQLYHMQLVGKGGYGHFQIHFYSYTPVIFHS